MSKHTGNTNRLQGLAFEEIIFKRAQYNGFFPEKNHLTAKYIAKGYGAGPNVLVVKSELDLKLIRRSDGRIAYVDAKCFVTDHFKFSSLCDKSGAPHQVDRAALLNSLHVPAGFIVWFQKLDEVVFYSGSQIAQAGPGSGFTPDAGNKLGSINTFSVASIFKAPEAVLTQGLF